MASSTVSSLLDFLAATPAQRSEAEPILSDFQTLSEDDKVSARANVLATVFPIIFGDIAVVKESPLYEEHRSQPWSTNCFLSPSVITTPSSATEVSRILALARHLGSKFSIRGGGHLQNPGFVSNDGGVVIALSRFTQLVLSDDQKTVDVGLGLRWLDVYRGLDEYGLTVAGGRVPPVGVPGLLLHGGLSFQNSECGLGCMGVVDYEVVLADSSIIHANKSENPDLFWALKGGGPNFGIVTKITMSTLTNRIWSAARIYSSTQNETLLEALMAYHDLIEKDNKASLIFQTIKGTTLVLYLYCAPVQYPDVFSPFFDIPHVASLVPDGCRTVYEMIQAVADVMAPEQLYHDMRTTSTLPNIDVYRAAETARLEQMAALADLDRADLTMVIQPMSSLTVKVAREKGGNPLGIEDVGQQWLLVMADYTDPGNEPRIRAAVRKIIDAVEETAKRDNTYLPFKYANYASRDQDPLAGYGRENLQKLKDIARRYDPEGIFQRLQGGGWLLSRVGRSE
ncbi:hypothetical protein BDV18DRAFT_162011 [Aspergillus unguis]